MELSDAVVFFISGVIYIAILYVLVRPGSQGASTVKLVGDALETLVRTSTGYTKANG